METATLLLSDVIIPYLVMSFTCMVILELLSGIFNLRGRLLRKSLDHMVGKKAAAEIYEHPLIRSLTPGRRQPAYIPSGLFSLAIVDLLGGQPSLENIGEMDLSIPSATDAPRITGTGPSSTPSPLDKDLVACLRALWRRARPGLEEQAAREWFNDVMDQASGFYRLQVTAILALLACGLVTALDLDALRITRYIIDAPILQGHLPKEEARAEAAETSAASNSISETDVLIRRLNSELPIFWRNDSALFDRGYHIDYTGKLIGLSLSTLFIIVGAPFAFDVLNRFMVIRSTVRPIEANSKQSDERKD